MTRTFRIAASLLSLALATACASPGDAQLEDDDETQPLPPVGTGGASSTDPAAGDPGDPGEGAAPPTGQGGDDTVVDAGPADVTAGLLYIHQQVFREDDAFARGGTAKLELYDPQPLPVDDRPEFFNAANERCTLESGTEWPSYLSGGGTWPAGPFINAGNLALDAAVGPGPVVYEYFDSYYLRLAPDPVQLGPFTHSYFYPPEYIPHGAPATLTATGGPDLGAFTVEGLQLAEDYTVYSPNLETGENTIDTGSPLVISWDPPAPGDQMSVIVKDSFSYIKCVFADDGQGIVPPEAMAQLVGGQFVNITIQTWREHHDTARVQSADGQQVDVDFTSRHAQIGRFPSQ